MAGADVKDAQAQMRALMIEHEVGHPPSSPCPGTSSGQSTD
jgi:hypothetical protein